MKRVLQIMGGMNRAGAETMIMNIYRCIDRSQIQFDFIVYSPLRQDYEEEILQLGGRIYHLRSKSIWTMFYSFIFVKRLLKNKEYIAVHAQTLHNSVYSLLAARCNHGVLRICHSHSTRNSVKSNIIHKLYELLSLKLIRKYTQVMLACGEEAGEYLFGEKFIKSGIVVKNGIVIDDYLQEYRDECIKLRRAFKIEDGVLIIGSVARLAPVKNHSFILKIAKCLKSRGINFRMLFVGQGELESALTHEILASGLSEQVTLLGVRSDIPVLLRLFDIFLMPSLFEGNPVSLIEAQASGLPCVISDVITRHIDLGLGLITQCELASSPETWCNKILCCPKRVNDITRRRDAVKSFGFDVKDTATQMLEIYLGNDCKAKRAAV
ncbi:MAG: glycosyltransferase family 1 protein [Proteobacteria bacterium]|nr:glycosyltransferase family 1 protein [Pseudomonadota bacterium]